MQRFEEYDSLIRSITELVENELNLYTRNLILYGSYERIYKKNFGTVPPIIAGTSDVDLVLIIDVDDVDPEMDIESSSLNIHLFGKHNFNNQIDYHLQLLVSEIFMNRKNPETETGNDFIIDDGLGQTKLFLRLIGDANDPSIKYDTREVRDKIASEMKAEKETIKEVLQNEFNIKSTKGNQEEPLLIEDESQQDFLIEWEAPIVDSIKKPTLEKKKTKPKGNKKEEKDFIIIWEEENDTIKDF